jgi:hypothetical protein
MAPSTSPNNHWIHLNMEGDHLEVNTTISHVLNGMAPFNFDEKTKTESVGPLPGFFLFVCFAGVVVTAMVTLKKARAASTAGYASFGCRRLRSVVSRWKRNKIP